MSLAGFRGVVEAGGFVVDAPTIGPDEARRRVLAHWSPGARLLAVGDGRWLLLLDSPLEGRAERAPGVTVTIDGECFVAAGSARDGEPGAVFVELRHGERVVRPLGALAAIDPGAWLSLAGFARGELVALDRPPEPAAAAATAAPPAVQAPDLRSQAGILAEPSQKAAELAAALREPDPASRRGNGRAQGAGVGAGAGGGAAGAVGEWLRRLVLRSPAGQVLGRRHARYLEQLTRAFEGAVWEDALRDAIALDAGEGAGGRLSLRLPSRRSGPLAPTPAQAGAGGSVPWGQTAYEHLRALYRRAAERLEAEGRIDEAAFVHADLLDAPRDAVALLTRHSRHELAARLAEGRELDADLVVGLWWRAGRRDRAIAVARLRGAWATAIGRLVELDLAGYAHELRLEWVQSLRATGDHLAAATAAWPDETLRMLVRDDLRLAREQGGARGATALALLASWEPEPEVVEDAVALLDGRDGAGLALRARVAATLAEHDNPAAAEDRRLCTSALRAVLRDGVGASGSDAAAERRLRAALRDRADPLLAADLPPTPVRRAPAAPAPRVEADPRPGLVGVLDAVVLGDAILVACGDAGVRLLGLDGRVKARWDVPADQLVVADHGAVALLVAHGEATQECHRLDLATRRVRRWTTLRARQVLPSFDGGMLAAVVEDDGIVLVDTLAEQPRAAWSELAPPSVVIEVVRSASRMAALVDVPLQGSRDERSAELWVWDVATMRLSSRELLSDDTPSGTASLTAEGVLVLLERDEDGEAATRHIGGIGRRWSARPAPPDAEIVAAGDHYLLCAPAGDGLLAELRAGSADVVLAGFVVPHASAAGLRVHGGVATVWDRGGRILGLDIEQRRIVANLRTHG